MTSDIDKFKESAGTGEVLIVIYMAGHFPGHKRRIVIDSVNTDENLMQVRENGKIKTYRIETTRIVDENYAAPWIKNDEGKTISVVPEQYFSEWSYTIKPHLYKSLGVVIREVIDKNRTQAARERAISSGMKKTDATKKIKVLMLEHVIFSPIRYAFEVGDIFYRGNNCHSDWVQIAAVKVQSGLIRIEAHWSGLSGRKAYHLFPHELADCLRSGVLPKDDCRIAKSDSFCGEILQFMIE